MRVLIVEDYEPLRTSVAQALREEGYSVDESANGEEAVSLATGTSYDVVVLDVMLPGLDGWHVLERLRKAEVASQVLMLTARDAVADRVRGLDLGADDYLVKPCAIEELLARVRALVRRHYQKKTPILRVGYLELDMQSHAVRSDGHPVELTAREYTLLEYLALRVGEVVTRTQIWEHIYDDRSSAASNVVDVYIGYLRKKIERAGLPRLLHTRRGEGYVLACDAKGAEAKTSDVRAADGKDSDTNDLDS